MNRLSKQLIVALAVSVLAAGCTTMQVHKQSSEAALIQGLILVKGGHYEQAVSPLKSGLQWLKCSPSFTQSSDQLVSKEVEYITKLIDQITSAKRKGVFRSSHQMAKIITTAMESQAKIIESIDKRRRDLWSPVDPPPAGVNRGRNTGSPAATDTYTR